MSRPTLTICTRCDGGEKLLDAVKALRRAEGLRDVFKVEGERCMDCCHDPIAIEFSGKKRSTYTRVDIRKRDAASLVAAAVAYAELSPGQELRERDLPGDDE